MPLYVCAIIRRYEALKGSKENIYVILNGKKLKKHYRYDVKGFFDKAIALETNTKERGYEYYY